MSVHRNALEHGVSPQDAIQAAQWSLWIEPLDDDGPAYRELRLGFDTVTRLLAGLPKITGTQELDQRSLPRSAACGHA